MNLNDKVKESLQGSKGPAPERAWNPRAETLSESTPMAPEPTVKLPDSGPAWHGLAAQAANLSGTSSQPTAPLQLTHAPADRSTLDPAPRSEPAQTPPPTPAAAPPPVQTARPLIKRSVARPPAMTLLSEWHHHLPGLSAEALSTALMQAMRDDALEAVRVLDPVAGHLDYAIVNSPAALELHRRLLLEHYVPPTSETLFARQAAGEDLAPLVRLERIMLGID